MNDCIYATDAPILIPIKDWELSNVMLEDALCHIVIITLGLENRGEETVTEYCFVV
jgi:hypothetical protein